MQDKTKVFIDGSHGTTGLRIHDRIREREDIDLLTIPDDLLKDPDIKKEFLNKADIVFLCLPDDAARQSVEMVEDKDVVLIDTSTAHRTSDGWCYGFPELKGQKERIRASKRIANPGCHAAGFISLAAPLVEEGIISKESLLSCFSVTGYSGGGKKMISQYEEHTDPLLFAPRVYGLSQEHKHLPEMIRYSGLYNAPVFCPLVASYYSGMETVISLTGDMVKGGIKAIKNCYKDIYKGNIVYFREGTDEGGYMSASRFAGRDDMEISVMGNEDRILLISRFDNLGKGASGSAIQNMNIVMGVPEEKGLVLTEEKI